MIHHASEGKIDILTLDAPRRNSLSRSVMRELIRALRQAKGRVIVLTANGPAFSAGHDLTEMHACSSGDAEEIFNTCAELMQTVQDVAQPVIAAVQGVATAAGCQLVATCDLAVAADTATFATPGVKIGLFCSTPMVALSRAIGRKRALEMLLTAKPIDAKTAADWGLINRAVPPEDLMNTALDLAQSIVDASPYTVALGKRAFYRQIDLSQPNAYQYTSEVMTVNALAEPAQEGIGAFLNKKR
jgi:enoyl-CoA hydratase/carnithine racemase